MSLHDIFPSLLRLLRSSFFSGLKRGACGHCKLSIFSGPRLSIFPFFFFFFLLFAVLLSVQPLCSPGGALLFGCALSPGLLWYVSPLPVYIFRFERYHRLLIQPVVLPLLALLVFTGGVGPRQEKARCRLPASCARELRSVSDDCMYHVRALNVRNINRRFLTTIRQRRLQELSFVPIADGAFCCSFSPFCSPFCCPFCSPFCRLFYFPVCCPFSSFLKHKIHFRNRNCIQPK